MSHSASLAAVVLLVASIGLDIAALLTTWWDTKFTIGNPSLSGVTVSAQIPISIWSIDLTSESSWVFGSVAGTGASWDEECAGANLDGGVQDWCGKINGLRALIILAAIFSLIGALGVAIGNYSGNTLVDAGSGFIGNVGNISGLLAIVIACTMSVDDLYITRMKAQYPEEDGWIFTLDIDKGPGQDGATPGFGLICAACVTQFLGGVFACVGTCQEIREVAYLAKQVKQKHDLEDGPPKTRAEKAHLEHDKDDSLARERYANLRKRQENGDPHSIEAGERPDQKDGGKEGVKPKVPRPRLAKVLFRQPDGEDDECPQSMLVDAFQEIDGDRSGSIEMDELIGALDDLNIAVSKAAADTIMKEIDKNASGDVDMREFIQFFRRIEELKRFDQKNQQRQQFASFLANFCFLADVCVVGLMLMLFINMDEAEDPESYAITQNVMFACIALLVFLFIMVILGPIVRLSFGPAAGRLQQQYEMAKELRNSQKKMQDDSGEQSGEGPRRVGYTADAPAPPVNAAMFGRSYLPQKVAQTAWAPPMEQIQPPQPPDRGNSKHSQPSTAPLAIQDHAGGHSHGGGGHSHVRKGEWKYNPAYYAHAREFGEVVVQDNKGPMSWSPMQIRTPGHESQMNAPGVPHALALTAMPGNMMR